MDGWTACALGVGEIRSARLAAGASGQAIDRLAAQCEYEDNKQYVVAVAGMTRRDLLRTGSAGLASVLLLACGKRGSPDPPTPVPRDVNVSVAVRAGERVSAVLEKVLPAVRYGIAPGAGAGMPTITEIPLVATTRRSYVAAVRQRAAAGEAPDVVWFSLQDDLPELLRGDLLRPLNLFLDNDPDNTLKGYHPESLDALQYWGQQMALPAALGVLSVRYDTETLAAREVAAPVSHWTWDDFAAMAATLTQSNGGGTNWGFSAKTVPAWLLFTISAGGRVADLGKGMTTLDEAEARRGFQFWLDLAHQYRALESGPQMTRDYMLRQNAGTAPTPLRLELINWHNAQEYSPTYAYVGTPNGPQQSVPLLVTDMVGVSPEAAELDAAYAVAKPLAAQLGSHLLVPPRNNAIEHIRRPNRRYPELALGLDRADVVLRSLSYSVGTTLSLHSGLGKALTEQMALPALHGSQTAAAALERGAAVVREWLGTPPG